MGALGFFSSVYYREFQIWGSCLYSVINKCTLRNWLLLAGSLTKRTPCLQHQGVIHSRSLATLPPFMLSTAGHLFPSDGWLFFSLSTRLRLASLSAASLLHWPVCLSDIRHSSHFILFVIPHGLQHVTGLPGPERVWWISAWETV